MQKDFNYILNKFKGKKILVIGDLIVDTYLKGSCTRIAPEASVPIIDLQSKIQCLGGAANVVSNLNALGAEVFFISIIGNDQVADDALTLLSKAEISSKYILRDQTRTTLNKTRVDSDSHTIVRFDEGSTAPINEISEKYAIQKLEELYHQVDGVVISDYAKGIMTPNIIQAIEKLTYESNIPIALDAKQPLLYKNIKPTLLKPNYLEAATLCGRANKTENRTEKVKDWGHDLYEQTLAKYILLTMDRDGVCCFKDGEFLFHECVPGVAIPKVSGAGDTFLAAAFISLIAGGEIDQVVNIAVTAADYAIKQETTARCTINELQFYYGYQGKLLATDKGIKDLIARYKSMGKKIVFTNGCFDILHSGHVSYLKGSKAKGDILIVGLNNDESIKRLKGINRPINKLEDRIEVLSELACIDYIIPFGKKGDDTPIELLAKVKPHVFVKGADYRHKYLPEESLLKKIGCEIVFMPMVANKSTTGVISQIREKVSANGAALN